LSGCSKSSTSLEAENQPARVEQVPGSEFARVVLTARAAERLGIKTAPVQAGAASNRGTVIPYSALLYGADGNAFVYTNPAPLIFVRSPISVTRIDGDVAYLSGGPDAGTTVVTVGAAELLGTEYGVGEG
jgi:hypothetical protein